jgi:FdhD protein
MKRNVTAVPEEVVGLRVNDRAVATWSCSPVAIEALAAGRLLTLGYVRSAADLLSIQVTVENGRRMIDAAIRPDAEAAGREDEDHRRSHGCGLRFLIDCRPDRLPARPTGEAAAGRAPVQDLATFPGLFRELFERSPSRKDGGGHHTAAVSDGDRLLHVYEEVGRHNGADKALGAALLAGLDLRALGLLTTARISGEMSEKAARAGLSWVASRSVPTTLAVAIAGSAGIPLVARAASPDARVFAPTGAGA